MPRTITLLFFAFLFAAFIYVLIGYFLLTTGWTPLISDPMTRQVAFLALTFVSLGDMMFGFVLKKKLAQKDGVSSLQKHLVPLVLAEFPAVLGLLCVFLTGQLFHLIVMFGISMVAFLLVKPPLTAE